MLHYASNEDETAENKSKSIPENFEIKPQIVTLIVGGTCGTIRPSNNNKVLAIVPVKVKLTEKL